MKKVAIVGAGQSRYGDFPDKGIKELFFEAYKDMNASVDKGLDPKVIESAYIGNLGSGGFQLGNMSALVTEYCGLTHINTMRIENACASGGYALVAAVMDVMSGTHKAVLAGGVEKMTDVSGIKQKYWLGVSGDTEYERLAGTTFSGLYALIAQRHMYEFGTKREHLSMVAVKNHKNGAQNPKAQFQREITLEQAIKGPIVASPLNLFDCCSTTDGASAVLVCDAEMAKQFTDTPVYVTGFGTASDFLAIHDRANTTTLEGTRRAGAMAYKMSGLTPKDIQLAEVHDCFTIAELLAYEDLGFCEKGNAGPFIEEGHTQIGGDKPVNASGGLKSKGHPIGSTGTGMAYEMFNQLRGTVQKPTRQVKGAEIGLIHNVGGSGGTVAVTVMRR
ncbi:MAG: 3-ketoacyl-CoA thiolase [Euryarchaeota archaeon RBG_19FT_COMBO_56_21]|nr:MAG: 3-ketoacyl-CoA thiolase [Euryarchaeota archaeon RBG_19FT_COMBO_56_21]